jgi:hypothetical protein
MSGRRRSSSRAAATESDDAELVRERLELAGVGEAGARLRVEVEAQLVGVLGVVGAVGQTWKPKHARLTAHATCATSAATRARDGVPLTVWTVVVCSHSGALSGTRF